MRIVMLADLHGNLPATQAMEAHLKHLAPDEIWFLGDAVGKGPSNAETCDWVREHCTLCLGGNWDYGIGGKEFAADGYFWDQLGPERMAWLNGLPREAEVTLGGVRFRLFHGRPVMPLMQGHDNSALLSRAFHRNGEDFGGVIFADSHRPFVRSLHDGYMINTGSVGNSMGVNRAHALLVEGEKTNAPAPLSFSILSVPYDNQAAAQIARQDEQLPHREAYIKEVLTGYYSR